MVYRWRNIYTYIIYTGWLVTGGTSGKGLILREKRSRKYRIKIFRLRLCFRENRLWIFARYGCTLSSCEQLKEKIIVAFHALKQSNTLESVHRNLIRRAEVCIRQNGQHFWLLHPLSACTTSYQPPCIYRILSQFILQNFLFEANSNKKSNL